MSSVSASPVTINMSGDKYFKDDADGEEGEEEKEEEEEEEEKEEEE
jgi:ribosomal protein L12E/L44/L45/RPP1/RPP2